MNRKPIIAELANGLFSSVYGEFIMHSFNDGHDEAVVLSMGDIHGASDILCRIQSECISSHVFYGTICDCREQMEASLKLIQDEGRGIVIYLFQEGRGNGAAAHIGTLNYRRQGIPQNDAYRLLGFQADKRDFGIAAKVLEYFGVKSVRLISGNKSKQNSLTENNIKVSQLIHYTGNVIMLGPTLNNTIYAIKDGNSISPISGPNKEKRIFVMGDLNVDYQIHGISGGVIANKPEPIIGGTGFNAAMALKSKELTPILFGKVGDDQHGRMIANELKKQDFFSLIGTHKIKPTGSCSIVFLDDDERWLMQDTDNANDYDLDNLEQAIALSSIREDDVIFLITHAFFRRGVKHSADMLKLLNRTNAKIVLDIVPHTLYKSISLEDLNNIIEGNVFAIIAEYTTFMHFLRTEPNKDGPNRSDYISILNNFKTSTIIVRYGFGNISRQTICCSSDFHTYEYLSEAVDTGYESTPNEQKRGFGDRLTAEIIKDFIRRGRL